MDAHTSRVSLATDEYEDDSSANESSLAQRDTDALMAAEALIVAADDRADRAVADMVDAVARERRRANDALAEHLKAAATITTLKDELASTKEDVRRAAESARAAVITVTEGARRAADAARAELYAARAAAETAAASASAAAKKAAATTAAAAEKSAAAREVAAMRATDCLGDELLLLTRRCESMQDELNEVRMQMPTYNDSTSTSTQTYKALIRKDKPGYDDNDTLSRTAPLGNLEILMFSLLLFPRHFFL
jgi:hypothetical protein